MHLLYMYSTLTFKQCCFNIYCVQFLGFIVTHMYIDLIFSTSFSPLYFFEVVIWLLDDIMGYLFYNECSCYSKIYFPPNTSLSVWKVISFFYYTPEVSYYVVAQAVRLLAHSCEHISSYSIQWKIFGTWRLDLFICPFLTELCPCFSNMFLCI